MAMRMSLTKMGQGHKPFQWFFSRVKGSYFFRRRRMKPILFLAMVLTLCTLMLLAVGSRPCTEYVEDSAKPNDDFIADWDADDPRLASHIRSNYMIPPTSRETPYNLEEPLRRDHSQRKQSMAVDRIFKGKRDGFFVEMGAYDGETYSNTLYFERFLNWTGLLVEAGAINFANMLNKKRKAWLLKGCVHGAQKPEKRLFVEAMEVGSTEENMNRLKLSLMRLYRRCTVAKVWCFPLKSVMNVINVTKVDYFSLDVEGGELPILKSIPDSGIDVSVIQVEYSAFNGAFWNKDESHKRLTEMRDFVKIHMPKLKEYRTMALDVIFARPELSTI
ncbi:unnamed protein product [Soboliphyme baturini]|uniref:Methyltransf_21 domain-containing protein n=1 Tax=Soboliphyme baturini TaxID=241478 RepID=A0A183IIG8_9BILA|nr:unnamed protein product [Soboliphyme baturini]